MANEKGKANPRTGQTSLTLGLSMVAGSGLTLMIIALALGVSEGQSADGDMIGLIFTLGIITFFIGLASWAAIVRPWEKFDDIDVPKYHGHHEEKH